MALRLISSSRPIVRSWVRSSNGSGMVGCGRTSGPSPPSMTPLPRSTRPTGSRGRRSSAFVHRDGEQDGDVLRGCCCCEPKMSRRRSEREGHSMKAIVVTDRSAGTAGMKLVERPDPDAARLASLEGANYGDVVVEVRASGFTGNELEWPSTWIDRLGRDRTPSIPGHEVAGVVTSLSYGATGLSVGSGGFGFRAWTRAGRPRDFTASGARTPR